MGVGRALATVASVAAVAGCIVVAAQLGGAADSPPDASGPATSAALADPGPSPSPERVVPTAAATAPPVRATPSGTKPSAGPSTPKPKPAATRPAAAQSAAPAETAPATTRAARPKPAASRPAGSPSRTPDGRAGRRGIALPLSYPTGDATRVVTVTATSRTRTVGHLQAWYKAPGGGWLHHGEGVTAYLGSAGMSASPSEGMSATPMGSFMLTQAFGRRADPGTPLPYFRTRPSDWWISQPGPLYNTHQRCASQCGFTQGAPNEHLYYETPYYDYAVVIDYNTANAPGGVRPGAGSAFFLHVHPPGTGPTAGCVAIGQDTLVALMRWLRPATHPRILIGVRS